MLPRMVLNGMPNSCLINVWEKLSDMEDFPPLLIQFAHKQYVRFSKFSPRCFFASFNQFWMKRQVVPFSFCLSILINTVLSIIGQRTFSKVKAITAGWVIAYQMANNQITRIFAVVQKISYTMSAKIGSSGMTDPKAAVAISVFACYPRPACVRATCTYLCPVSLNILKAKIGNPKIGNSHRPETYPFSQMIGLRGVHSVPWAAL